MLVFRDVKSQCIQAGFILAQLLRPARPGCRGLTAVIGYNAFTMVILDTVGVVCDANLIKITTLRYIRPWAPPRGGVFQICIYYWLFSIEEI